MENVDGKVSFEDGNINVVNPVGLGRFPRIKSGENIEIYVEDEKKSNEIVVSEEIEDNIFFKIKKEEKDVNINLKLSEDKMKAYLLVDINSEKKFKIKNKEAANEIIIETEVIEEEFPNLTSKEIITLLEESNISYGVKHDYIREIVRDGIYTDENKFIIAEGKKPEKGKDAELIKSDFFKKHKENMFNKIKSFEKGEVICYKKEGKLGKAGINVLGEKIPPPKTEYFDLVASKNVNLSPDGLKAIALKSGQPKIRKKENEVIVKVVKQYILEGDIDKNTGNIKYEGDLLVKGNIKDYFNVDVGSDLKVNGNVANANISTKGNVYVNNNIISSNLRIGNYLEEKTIKKLNKVINRLSDFKKAVVEILGVAKKRDINISQYRTGKIIKLLFDNKFEDTVNLVLELNENIENDTVLKDSFAEIVPYFKDLKKLKDLENEDIFLEFKNQIKRFLNNRSNNEFLDIRTGYIQNSNIKIGGSVIINKSGCYNSDIEAKDSIIVKNSIGYIKGGNYKAQNLIYSNKAGNRLGETNFYIGGQIYIKKALGSLVIKSKRDKKVITADENNINLKVNKNKKLERTNIMPEIDNY